MALSATANWQLATGRGGNTGKMLMLIDDVAVSCGRWMGMGMAPQSFEKALRLLLLLHCCALLVCALALLLLTAYTPLPLTSDSTCHVPRGACVRVCARVLPVSACACAPVQPVLCLRVHI
jgi:hypothetical protein